MQNVLDMAVLGENAGQELNLLTYIQREKRLYKLSVHSVS